MELFQNGKVEGVTESVSNSSEVSLEPPSTFNVKITFHLRCSNYRV